MRMNVHTRPRGQRPTRRVLLGVAAAASLLLLPMASTASPAANATGDVSITRAWARPTVPGQPVAAAYFDITSTSGATLTQLRSDVAGTVQMHAMTREGDVMRMRELPTLALPAGQTVRLQPGGTHLMLLQLKRPLRAGDSIPLDLTLVDAAGRRQVVHAVVPVTANPPAGTSP
jgi:copper(I)-binding protein